MRLCVRQITQQYCGRRLHKGKFGGKRLQKKKTITMTVLRGGKGDICRETWDIELTGLGR